MASSACNRIVAIGLAMGVLGGCALVPEQPEPEQQPAAQEAKPEGLTDAQKSAFESGAAALNAGNADRAVDIFRQLTKAKPGLAAAHANLGTALMMRGDDALATSSFERATALDPALAEAQVRLGVLYRRSGNFDKAEDAYKAALDQQTDNRYAHLNLGILYDVYLQRPAQALTHYKRFQELSEQPDEKVAKWISDLQQRR